MQERVRPEYSEKMCFSPLHHPEFVLLHISPSRMFPLEPSRVAKGKPMARKHEPDHPVPNAPIIQDAILTRRGNPR